MSEALKALSEQGRKNWDRIFGRPLADCDCPETDETINETYYCEECGAEVLVCPGCYTIVSGCNCGHCPDGVAFCESDG